MQAVRQVVFTDALFVGRLDLDGQSFAPIGLHKIDAASDWLLIKRPISVNFRQHCQNLSHETDPLRIVVLHVLVPQLSDGYYFAYVAHFVFLRNVWIRTQEAAAASRRPTN